MQRWRNHSSKNEVNLAELTAINNFYDKQVLSCEIDMLQFLSQTYFRHEHDNFHPFNIRIFEDMIYSRKILSKI